MRAIPRHGQREAGIGEERRDQHHAPDAVDQRGRAEQRDQRAGRMGEDVVRTAAVRQHHLLEEAVEILHVVAESRAHGRAARSRSSRSEPPWPRQSNIAVVKPRSERFFAVSKYFSMHSLRPAQHDDRALERPRDRRKAAVAQLLAVEAGEIAAGRLLGHGIAGNFVEDVRHEALSRRWVKRRGRSGAVEMSRQVIESGKRESKRPRHARQKARPEDRLSRSPGLCRSGRKGRCTRLGLVAMLLSASLRHDEDISRSGLNAVRSGGSSAVHRNSGSKRAEKALKCHFSLPKCPLRPPISGAAGPAGTPEGFTRVPHRAKRKTMLLNRRTNPCVTSIFPRSIARP